MTREEAVKWLQGIEERYFNGGDEAYDKKRREAVRMAIEALERQQGKWLLDGRCSECLVATLTSHKNYCPNCGADMRKILPKP